MGSLRAKMSRRIRSSRVRRFHPRLIPDLRWCPLPLSSKTIGGVPQSVTPSLAGFGQYVDENRRERTGHPNDGPGRMVTEHEKYEKKFRGIFQDTIRLTHSIASAFCVVVTSSDNRYLIRTNDGQRPPRGHASVAAS